MNQDELEVYRRIIELESALGMAIGALEVIRISPTYFNVEGLILVLDKLKKVAGDE